MSKRAPEEWRDVVGYEGYYRISDRGRVWSVRSDRLLSLNLGSHGYLQFTARVHGKRRTLLVSREVLRAFVGEPDGYQEACHNNGRRTDNRLLNLRWDSQVKNARDRIKHGTQARGETNGQTKLTEAQARNILKLRGHLRQEVIGGLFGITQTAVSLIQSGRNWAHLKV